jgi:N-acetylmuramic acid 6-phosphate (MurNAc-6-P) etherase
VIMILSDCGASEAREKLLKAGGNVRQALK